MLFTADLRAFSERLTTKIEVKEIKEEDDAKVLTEIQVQAEISSPTYVKRELDDEKSLVAIEEVTAGKPVKRRRKAYADTEILR